MSEDLVNFEVDGIPLKAEKGSMLIRATDAAGIHIPRFCYHDKLSVAANCRMCLVEVERAPKPMPACATPVAEGMKVYTRSPKALAAQKSTMEFLLINHPLDCPVCDQGGECELQDVSMGFGEDISRYSEPKRAVKDQDIGPLIATEMTRCIHCTRCVRFGEEIAGMRELGATGRGENMEIGTFVAKTVASELSGNVIDLCPVGALTAKPSRFTYRAWELVQHATVAPHDCVGSNLYLHTYNGQAMRVVPRRNDGVNETWISDRDRFSYTGLSADDRLTQPMIRQKGEWVVTDWETALTRVVEGLRAQPAEACGALLSPQASLEELYLAQQWLRGLGIHHLDHRLRQSDFSDQGRAPLFPYLGGSLESLEQVSACLLVGSNIRKDQPMAAHRLRKAALDGAAIMAINVRDFPFHFPVQSQVVVDPQGMVMTLAAVAAAALEKAGGSTPRGFADLLKAAQVTDEARAMAERLAGEGDARILLGIQAQHHPQFSLLRALGGVIADLTGATLGYLSEGGNASGAWLAGAVPHRGPGGAALETAGQPAGDWLSGAPKGCVLLNVEPDLDCADPAQAMQAMENADFVVALTPFAGESLRKVAHVLLPVSTFAETAGTYVNAEGRWQSVKGAATPPGEARPAWKVLRVLGNMCDLAGFEYLSSEQVRDEVKARLAEAGVSDFDTRVHHDGSKLPVPPKAAGLQRVSSVGLYAIDSLVRRSRPLQATPDAGDGDAARINAAQARSLDLSEAAQVVVRQGKLTARMPLVIDESIPEGCAWLPAGVSVTSGLGPSHGPVEFHKV
ncbi:NADH-quinone oxidoreductase subunit NuoG [Ectothiorhodospira variabilis]|uniref:NADH-quinone oxidoreductase subunit NuoG n=1 Tax=Ectothiorhodospira variabilis TaxID=505694 RepID=UPI001EFA445E|nr:NADH-quinone oxidoreductase subunit NuoG [Ectothiorhodospira variabilis]MCG5493187.1 NADH-quinone oxidoreductase subunit NuoG [Ectothiorhodospira variabilis]MCG5502516.1 NADH-quinone oxidoreductase subunit NuoG [Ectothiorhodospira variabilis]MCG5505718.1 NADH-quinone oxidoreductase subunit NuoG [Ectothiorhodospira variabilis]